MAKWGLIVRKKEMTRLPVGDSLTAVTLLQVLPQSVVRYKTEEKDGYNAVVIGAEKKELDNKKGMKVKFGSMVEFAHDEDYKQANAEGTEISGAALEGVEAVNVSWISKGKGFQWVMKRHGAKWGPETHGSKFHRHIGSLGNRKPRRVMKGHPHHGHMGSERVTLHSVSVVDVIDLDNETLVVVKWSVPGAYNSLLTLEIN